MRTSISLAEGENDTYFVFLLQAENDQIKIDGVEVDNACYFTVDEVQNLPQLQSLSQLMVTSALLKKSTILPVYNHSQTPLEIAVFCAGADVEKEFENFSHLLWYEPVIPKANL